MWCDTRKMAGDEEDEEDEKESSVMQSDQDWASMQQNFLQFSEDSNTQGSVASVKMPF